MQLQPIDRPTCTEASRERSVGPESFKRYRPRESSKRKRAQNSSNGGPSTSPAVSLRMTERRPNRSLILKLGHQFPNITRRPDGPPMYGDGAVEAEGDVVTSDHDEVRVMDTVPEIQEFEAPDPLSTNPGQVESPTAPTLYGRDEEMTVITSHLSSVTEERRGHVLFLVGESGTGKTALARWAVAQAADSGFAFAQTPCEPFHAGIPLFPIKELMRQLTRGTAVTEFISQAFGHASYEADIARSLESEAADTVASREYTMATFANVVLGRWKASDTPVLLFLDDVERIDAASADAVIVLMSRMVDQPVFLLGAARSDIVELDQDNPARAIITKASRQFGNSSVQRIATVDSEWLGPLVDSFLGGHCDADEFFLDRLMLETEGNPLFVREVIHSLTSSQGDGLPPALERTGGVWHLSQSAANPWTIPKSIEDAIEMGLRPLAEGEREVLNFASVIGRQFRYDTLMQLSQYGDSDLMTALEHLEQLDIIHEVPGSDSVFQFTHGKVQDVIYSELSGIRRTRLHARIAEIIQQQRDSFPEDHWEYIVGVQLYKARKYDAASPFLENAGRTNLRMQVARDAVDALQMCVDSLEKSNTPDTKKLAEVRLLLGESLKTSGKLDPAMRELEQVLAVSAESPTSARWAQNHMGDIYRMKDQVDLALRSYDQCEVAATTAGDQELLVENAADLAELHMRQYERLSGLQPGEAMQHQIEYKKYLDTETTLAANSDDPLVQARSFRNQAKFERSNGNPTRAIALYERSVGSDSHEARSHRFLIPYAKALRLVGRSEDAERAVREVLNWSIQLGALPSQGIARQYLGLLLMERLDGSNPDLAEQADRELRRAFAIHKDVGFSQGVRETTVNLFELQLRLGNVEEARSWLRKTESQLPGNDLEDSSLATAVVAQLRANGELQRAEDIEARMDLLLP